MQESLLRSIQRSVKKLPRGGRGTRAALAAKFALRRLLLRFGDRPVRHAVGNYELRFPFSHNYPIDSLLRSPDAENLVRIAAAAHEYFDDFRMIDIGANVGDTVAELRNAALFPILAVEGDPDYYRYLEKNVGSWEKVVTEQALLGDEAKEVRGRLIENYGGSKQFAEDEAGTVRIETLDGLLERHPDFRAPRLVKIDTDGYDFKIIRGARRTLTEAQPILFFEYDPHHLTEQGEDARFLFSLLAGLNYYWLLIYEGNGDFMASGRIDDDRFLQEMHAYFSGRASKKYADICAFPLQERTLFEHCRLVELEVAGRRGTVGSGR